ncbi:hypothetical protein [Microbacterium sp. 5K110]|jgi:ABC-type amino acid transport system permease subunit|uniref:hypothetical protein n=1 Tax=unclassified Microbacterium TaxID=2609290 RepID=UPI001485A2F2|nr:hypothetical protein [Microbacterium sp. 5K110]
MTKAIEYAAIVVALIAATLAFIAEAVWAGSLAVLAAALTGYATISRESTRK